MRRFDFGAIKNPSLGRVDIQMNDLDRRAASILRDAATFSCCNDAIFDELSILFASKDVSCF